MMHVTDWFPTLLSLSGTEETLEGLDGVNQWEALNGGPAARNEFLYNIHHDKTKISGAIRQVGLPDGAKFAINK